MVIALSGNKNDTTCGHPYVQCFDQSSSTGPSLLHIQGWSAAGTPSLTGPLARSVALSAPAGSTCSDAYYSNTTTTCTETISAWVDYGSTNTKGVTVKPVVAGSTGERPDARGDQRQRRSMDRDDLAQASRSEQDRPARRLREGQRRSLWHEHVDVGDDLQRSTSVRRWYGIGPDLGCLALGGWRCAQDANSFEVCEPQNTAGCTHNLAVTINVAASLQNSQHFADPTYPIRIGTSQGNVVGCGANRKPVRVRIPAEPGQGVHRAVRRQYFGSHLRGRGDKPV